jgi:hypothetical protein
MRTCDGRNCLLLYNNIHLLLPGASGVGRRVNRHSMLRRGSIVASVPCAERVSAFAGDYKQLPLRSASGPMDCSLVC